MSRTKKAVYDKYKGVRTLENCARTLLDLLATLDNGTVSIVPSGEACPRCAHSLKQMHQEPRFRRVMAWCTECHYFILWDRLGRVKTFASEHLDNRPLNLPPVPQPRRPLERLIHNHMQNIKKESN